jgi:hypothetical protein
MFGRPVLRPGIRLISITFSAVLAAGSGGCSEGERGLVLARIGPQAQGGEPPGLAGTSGTGAWSGSGGAASGAGNAATAGDAGDSGTGAAGAPGDSPPWVAERCTPTLNFENRDTTSQGQLFTDAVPDPSDLVWGATHDACRVLFRSPSEVKAIDELTLIVENYSGIAGVSGTTLRISTSYLKKQSDAGRDLPREIAGIMRFTTSLVYQHDGSQTAPGWLMSGIADFVRLESGYLDRDVSKGGNYDDSSQTTAFFLDYLRTRRTDVVYQINLRLAPGEPAYTDDVFIALMGSDLATLWDEYQATL